MKAYWLVFVGGGAGSLLRYLRTGGPAGRVIPASGIGHPFPVAILFVNVLASVLLGAVVGWATGKIASEDVRLLLSVGFCGGLSTFSSFSYDTVALLQNGRPGAALLNMGLNVLLCLLASVGGLVFGQKL